MSTANATSTSDPAARANLGKAVWFTYTPCANGTVTAITSTAVDNSGTPTSP